MAGKMEPNEAEFFSDAAAVIARSDASGIKPLERLGALAIRFLHQISNDMTCMSSGLNLMEEGLKEGTISEGQDALEQAVFLNQAYQRMNATVSEFSSVRRSLRFNGLHPEVSGVEAVSHLAPLAHRLGFGSLQAEKELGRIQVDVRWLEECLLLVRDLLPADPGANGAAVGLAPYEQVRPLTGSRFGLRAPERCFFIELRGVLGVSVLQAQVKAGRALAAVLLQELLRQMRGVLAFDPSVEGRVLFYFPSL